MAKKNTIAQMIFGRPDDDRDDIYDEEEEIINDEGYEEDEVEEQPAKKSSRNSSRESHRSNKVVNISTTAQLQVVVLRPESLNEVGDVANHLKDKRTVAINFENTSKEVKRRMLDFLQGVTFANNGRVTKIDGNVYLMTPYNVGLMGDDIIDELEHSGMSFE